MTENFVQTRLKNLEQMLEDEKKSDKPDQKYITDLIHSIEYCKMRLDQMGIWQV